MLGVVVSIEESLLAEDDEYPSLSCSSDPSMDAFPCSASLWSASRLASSFSASDIVEAGLSSMKPCDGWTREKS